MSKIVLSSAQILNIALGLIIVLGSLATVKYSNFDGVSFDELGEKYISKSDVKFSDLPLEMQKNYIDKKATIEQSKEGNLFEDEYLDDKGMPIPESEVTKQDFKRTINKLQKTLLFLQHDNLLMSNEKNELSKKIDEQQTELEEQRNQLISKNTERLNEAEQQHYRNISDLTIKINELQKENVIISQKANIEANSLKGQIEDLNAKAVEAEDKKYLEIKKAREDEQAKLIDYKEKIKFLNDQIALLNEQINTNNETAKNAFVRKQDEINTLKDEMTRATQEKNELMKKQTQALVVNEQKHKEEIAQYAKTIEQLKLDTEKLIATNHQDMATQDEDHAKKMAIQEEKIKNGNAELASAKKHIDALMLESEKDFNKFRTYLEDEKKLNKELTIANKQLEENAQNREKNLNTAILKLNEEIAKKDVNIKALSDKITALNSEKITIEAEVKKRVDENDMIHNKNYKIFNEKIANFNTSKKELIEKLDKQLDEYKETAKETYNRMQFHTNELTQMNNELKLKHDEKEKEIQALKTQLVAFKTDGEKVKTMDEEKIKELRATLETFKTNIKTKESSYLDKIQTLEADIKAKDATLANNAKDATLKIVALEKESKNNALELQSIRDENLRYENSLKTLHVKLKEAETNATKATNKTIEELKAKLALIEKNRVSEDTKMVGLKEELRRQEIEYLDALKARAKELKTKETQLVTTKEEVKKSEAIRIANEDKIAKLKEESKQKELNFLATTKALQAEIKTKETQLSASNKEETMKIIALEKELKSKEAQILASKENIKKIEAIKVANEEKVAKLKEETKQLQLQNLEATKTLKSELKAKETQLNASKKDETLKIIALEKDLTAKENALTQNKDTFSKRIASHEQTIKTLTEKIKLLEATISKPVIAKASTPTTSKGHKLSMIDKVTCSDMGTGNNAITESCKKEVQTFLSKYDSSYFFEVAPIVDNGGFASLKLIKSKKVGVEDTEIDRITGLANIGLGKARAKAGGELIENYVGDNAKISYSLSNIEQNKARGFQIRVYQ